MYAINGFFEKKVSLWKETFVVIGASFLISLCSKISIPLFFTPVPITIQPSLILLFSALLGSKRAVAMMSSFLAQVVIGFPVLSSGAIGIAAFFGPTGGYIFGYLAAAFVTGFLMERSKEKTARAAFLAMGAGNLVIYLLGAAFLSLMVGIQSAFWLGVAPFVLSDLFKLLVSVKVFEKVLAGNWLSRENRQV